jgi:hypothetical protein
VTRLSGSGLSIDVVRGWEAEISTAPLDGVTAAGVGHEQPVLHAANFGLPVQRGEYGAGAMQIMGPRHVFLSLVEFEREAAGTPLFDHPRPGPLTTTDLDPSQLQLARAGQTGCQRFFTEAGRAFCLYAVVGSELLRPVLVPRLNEVIGAIGIDTR